MGLNGRHMTCITDFFTKKKMFPKKFETRWELRNFQLIKPQLDLQRLPYRDTQWISEIKTEVCRAQFSIPRGGTKNQGLEGCEVRCFVMDVIFALQNRAKHDVYKLKKDLNLKHNCLKT